MSINTNRISVTNHIKLPILSFLRHSNHISFHISNFYSLVTMKVVIMLALVVVVAVAVTYVHADDCVDSEYNCATWAAKGKCSAAKIAKKCPKACNLCGAGCEDDDEDCGAYARRGDCDTNPKWMTKNCRKSCNVC